MQWICDFQVRLKEGERLSCVKEVEISSSSTFIITGGKSTLHVREVTTCIVLLWLHKIRLYLPHCSITVKSLDRREAEMFLWNRTSS